MADLSKMNGQQRLVLIVCILASFVAFLDGSVVNVALPAIARDLGGGLNTQQWVVDSYLITLGALMLVAGSLSDLFGRKQILTIGLVGFAAASILCAVAPNATFLIAMRALQGVAGALLVPSSLAIIIAAFSGKAQGKAIGTWTAWTGIAFVIGPLLGGFMIDTYSWRLIFAINIIPVAVTLWLMKYLRLSDKKRGNTRVDYIGAILCSIGLGGSVYALIEQSHYGWSSPIIYSSLVLGILAFVAFLWYERRTAAPMLPLSLFKIRNFSVGNVATLFIYAGLAVSTFIITVFVQQTGGYTAIEAGLALLPVTIIMFLFSSRFGALSATYGPRLFMTLGPALGGLGFLLMLSVNESVNYWTQIFPGVIVFGLGLTITVAPLTSAILSSISAKQAGIGSAVNNAVARIAGLVAIAVLGIVVGTTLDLAGFHKGVEFMAVLLLLGAAVSAVGIRNPKAERALEVSQSN